MSSRTEIAEEVGRWFKFVVVGTAVVYIGRYVYSKFTGKRTSDAERT